MSSETIWSADGQSLAILDRSNAQFCVLYDDQPDESTDRGAETSLSRSNRWDANEGLTHVSETEEEGEEEEGHSTGGVRDLSEAEEWWRGSGGKRGSVTK